MRLLRRLVMLALAAALGLSAASHRRSAISRRRAIRSRARAVGTPCRNSSQEIWVVTDDGLRPGGTAVLSTLGGAGLVGPLDSWRWR